MDLRTYLTTIAKNYLLIAICTVIGLGAGIALFISTSPSYQSSVDFYVSTPVPASSNPQSSGQYAESRVNSYILLLGSEELAARVIDATNIQLTPQQISRKIDASSEINTVIVNARVTDTSAERSLQIARGLTQAFPKLVDELDNSGRATDIVTINVISGPNLRSAPVAPNRTLYLGAGAGIGLLLGLVIGIVRELANTSVRSGEMATEVTGVPVLGTIADDPDTRQNPLIIGRQSISPRAETFRQLRTNLDFLATTQPADVMLVTSAVPKEGKSTVAANVALSLIEKGERVLLLDGDLREPRLGHLLDLPGTVGLTDVLIGKVSAVTAVQQWGDSSGYFLSSGTVPPNPSEMLGSDRMREVMEELRGSFDKIVIDSSPVLPVADAAVTSNLVDAVLLVIRCHKTTRSQIHRAMTALGHINAPVVGSTLNMAKIKRTDYVYGRRGSSPARAA